ncbi:hypothetical protein BDV41DRAFT_536136 [Aspergillus transmontanensis]|uniref:Uncharacterized protein n=1 Tax=Aspergillus transmontanensis TaxID=1034304 RepID=A0A5N6VZM2_9EURO|nr:hypothetical protein BDV41DRAFT_536136 [Aspergillus transmontanensis]
MVFQNIGCNVMQVMISEIKCTVDLEHKALLPIPNADNTKQSNNSIVTITPNSICLRL